MVMYNLNEASTRINSEIFSHIGFRVTPRILCDWGRIDEGRLLRVYVAYKGKAISKANGEIDITRVRYFEVLPITLEEFEMADTINIPALFDSVNGEALLIDPPIVVTTERLRVAVDDVKEFSNYAREISETHVRNLKLALALRNYNTLQTDSAPAKTKAVNGEEKPWQIADVNDPSPVQPWYTPARYFARKLVTDDSTLLTKRDLLAEKTAQSLKTAGIYGRIKNKKLDAGTIKKAFSKCELG